MHKQTRKHDVERRREIEGDEEIAAMKLLEKSC